MRGVLVFSDAICCDTATRFYLFACRQSRAGGVLWIARCLIRALKSLHTPLPIQSHLWLFWSDFRESGELCAVLWSFASICESCRRAKGRDGRGGHRCCAELEFAQRCNVIPEPTGQPPCQPLSQAAKQPAWFPRRWHRPAGTANPSLPLPQLAGSLQVGLSSWRLLRGWQTSPRWPPCSEAGFALASLLHHSPGYRAVAEKASVSCAATFLLREYCTWEVGVLNSAAALTLSNDDLSFELFVELLFRKPVIVLGLGIDADMKNDLVSPYWIHVYTPAHTHIRINTAF